MSVFEYEICAFSDTLEGGNPYLYICDQLVFHDCPNN